MQNGNVFHCHFSFLAFGLRWSKHCCWAETLHISSFKFFWHKWVIFTFDCVFKRAWTTQCLNYFFNTMFFSISWAVVVLDIKGFHLRAIIWWIDSSQLSKFAQTYPKTLYQELGFGEKLSYHLQVFHDLSMTWYVHGVCPWLHHCFYQESWLYFWNVFAIVPTLFQRNSLTEHNPDLWRKHCCLRASMATTC